MLNSLATLRDPGFDANVWWVDLRPLPPRIGAALLAVAGGLLVALAVRRPEHPSRRRPATIGACGVLAVAAGRNVVGFAAAWMRGDIDPMLPVPLSAVLCIAFILLTIWLVRVPGPWVWSRGFRPWIAVGVVSAGFVVGMPFAQILWFGTTSYARPADAIVVFGAKVHEGGTPSLSLQDRMTRAVRAYGDGLAPVLIVSGGVGESGDDEAVVMARMAMDAGVPPEAIVLDHDGVSTLATVRNTAAIAESRDLETVLAVSHPYHLPRIKLEFEDTGVTAYTVPSDTTWIPQLPGIVAREVPALWVGYLRALV